MKNNKDHAEILCHYGGDQYFTLVVVGTLYNRKFFRNYTYSKGDVWCSDGGRSVYSDKSLDKAKKLFNMWKDNKSVDTRDCKNCKLRFKCITSNFDNIGEHE